MEVLRFAGFSADKGSMKTPSRHSIWRIAGDYCRDNWKEFTRDSNSLVTGFLLRPWFTLFPLFAGALANATIVGTKLSFLFLAPSAFLALLPLLLRKAKLLPRKHARYAPLYFDGVLLSIALCLSAIWGHIYAHHLLDGGEAPVQITLVALCLLPFNARFSRIVIRNLVLTAAMAVALAFFDAAIPLRLIHHFVGGMGVGTALSFILHETHKSRFYTAAIHRKLNSHFTVELERLVYPHQVAALARRGRIEETMPLHASVAQIGEFDIVNSSEVSNRDEYHQLKNQAFEKCYQRLLRNYRFDDGGATPSSEGHIAKEMGDGFIFSVGYPFRLPSNEGSAAVAFALARDFITLFHETFKAGASGGKQQCVVVLTEATLQGFWTSFRVKRYDFKQDAVTKLARFSETRRHLQTKGVLGKNDSYILMDEPTMKALPAGLAGQLHVYDLTELGIPVRGFPEIRNAFVFSLTADTKKAAA